MESETVRPPPHALQNRGNDYTMAIELFDYDGGIVA
jgi:hypothetical protein